MSRQTVRQRTDEKENLIDLLYSRPGPELEHRLSDHDQTNSPALPSPPLFSPPAYNHATLVDDPRDNSLDMSLSHSSNPTNDLDLTLESSQNNSRGSIEPHTPEPVAPNLSFINFVTGQTPSLSLHKLGEPEEKISVTNEEETLDRSTDLEVDDSVSHDHDDQLADEASVHPPEDQPSTTDNDQFEEKNSSADGVDHEAPASKSLPPSQTTKSLPQDTTYSTENWLDISRTEFQVAIGLFAVPWSTMIILSRVINQLAILTFSQPIANPITGLFTSIFAPSLLYSSLITLLITSFDHLG